MNVLIISNNCISKAGAAGRTIANFFDEKHDYNLAQFYIGNEIPDFDLCCKNFFRITDREMLNSFLKRRNVGKVITQNDLQTNQNNNTSDNAYVKKTVLTFLLRNLVWRMGHWKSPNFINWIDSFSPDVIFLVNTDCAFLIKIAMFIAKSKNIPIVIYNTESYYFYTKCYLYQSGFSKILYPVLYMDYKRVFKKLITYASTTVHNCLELRDLYFKEFQKSNSCIYASTDIKPQKKYNISTPPTFVYMGNLGLNRYKSLIEIGDALNKIDKNIQLDVYGSANAAHIINTLMNTKSINYKGVIPYERVIDNMYKYDFLVHAESFEADFIKNVEYGFSTKIADSLASGTCLVAYGDKSISFIKYLIRENAACVITNPSLLEGKLADIINNHQQRKTYVDNAATVAQRNHSQSLNIDIIYQILKEAVANYKGDKQ